MAAGDVSPSTAELTGSVRPAAGDSQPVSDRVAVWQSDASHNTRPPLLPTQTPWPGRDRLGTPRKAYLSPHRRHSRTPAGGCFRRHDMQCDAQTDAGRQLFACQTTSPVRAPVCPAVCCAMPVIVRAVPSRVVRCHTAPFPLPGASLRAAGRVGPRSGGVRSRLVRPAPATDRWCAGVPVAGLGTASRHRRPPTGCRRWRGCVGAGGGPACSGSTSDTER